MIEFLESRIAPAAILVNATTATYHDVDGDLVTVHFSKAILTQGNLGSVLTTVAGGTLGGEQLTAITLTGAGLAASPQGTSITLTAKPQIIGGISHGDGLANVGSIDASDANAKFDLGAVSVPGDLDHLTAGSSTSETHAGLASLTVGSLGYFGGSSLVVTIGGAAGAVKVKSDVIGMTLSADAFGSITIGGDLRAGADGTGGVIKSTTGIGQVKIGGDVRGGSAASSGLIEALGGKLAGVSLGGSLLAGDLDFSGLISSQGDMGLVKIGGDVKYASAEPNTGYITSGGKLAGVMIGGGMTGNPLNAMDGINSAGDLGFVQIGGPTTGAHIASTSGKIGNVVLGSFDDGGVLSTAIGLGNVLIKGICGGDINSGGGLVSITLDQGMQGGSITSHLSMGAVKINGSVTDVLLGSDTGAIASVYINGDFEGLVGGQIECATTLGPVVIAGSLLGGFTPQSGSIQGATITSVKIGHDLHGGESNMTGVIGGTHVGFVEVDGSVIGGGGGYLTGGISADSIGTVHVGGGIAGGVANSGFVTATGDIGSVTIGADLAGTSAGNSGYIFSGGNLGKVSIAGSIIGAGAGSGRITSGGNMGAVTIGGNLVGGTGTFAGVIDSSGSLGSVKIGGSVIGGTADSTGRIDCAEVLSSLTIGGDLIGGNLADPGTGTTNTGYILGGHLPHVVIGGSVRAGVDTSTKGSLSMSGAIVSINEIGSLTVLGSLVGNVSSSGDLTTVFIGARGHANVSATVTTDVAIASLHVAGRVEYANIVAGYDFLANAPNADAQIGTVKVDGNWIATNLVAGIDPGADGYGNANDAKLTGKDNSDARGAVSKIASVIIGGNALGTASTSDGMTFGIEAQQIGSIHLGGALVPLTPGAKNDLFATARPLGVTLISQGTTHPDFNAFEVG